MPIQHQIHYLSYGVHSALPYFFKCGSIDVVAQVILGMSRKALFTGLSFQHSEERGQGVLSDPDIHKKTLQKFSVSCSNLSLNWVAVAAAKKT